jgi:glycosyltransferase involved in cell wall biosynthesis
MPSSLIQMKKVVVPNCYDPILQDIKSDFLIKKENIHILYISFLMKTKGIFLALDVFEKIANEYDHIYFNIAGQPHSDELMSKTEVKLLFDKRFKELNENFPQRFKYHGVVKGDEKIKTYINSDILLFPTFFKSESFGIVNVEAMRTGNAIVTTNHNFLPDIVSSKEGVLVEPNNFESTYKGVKYLLDNRNILLKIQKHNVEHSKKLFSPEKFNTTMLKLFSQYSEVDNY